MLDYDIVKKHSFWVKYAAINDFFITSFIIFGHRNIRFTVNITEMKL